VVIPALNEEKNLPYVFEHLPEGLHEVILVDGLSVDGTVETARALYPGIRTVAQDGRGKGNALAAGYSAVTGDIVVTLDSDGSADPREIPAFVGTLLSGADFAKGSRFLQGGGSTDITRFRSLGNKCLTILVNMLYRTRYTDLCYGYNAFWARHIPALTVDYDGFEFEMLVNVRIAKVGLKVAEVPSFELERIHGESNLHAIRDGVAVFKAILREYRRKLPSHAARRERPALRGYDAEDTDRPEKTA
jgi:glycosyltransferase involved in cell wall biosynthesis